MSSSISIRPGPSSAPAAPYTPTSKATVQSSSSSSYSGSPRTPRTPRTPSTQTPKPQHQHQRRPSLLSPAISRQECTVINIGDPDGPPRLISYLSSSQGFAWNPEIFIPSYIDCDYVPLENRRDPVHEIYLSDEEAKNMLPQ